MEGSILEAEGLEIIGQSSGSPSTTTFFIQSYFHDSKIAKKHIYALKTVTLMPPTTTKNFSQQSVSLKYKEEMHIRTQIKALSLLKPYRAIVQLCEVLTQKEEDKITNDFFRQFLGRKSQKGTNFGLLLEYCSMGSLADKIKKNSDFLLDQVIKIGLQICECLECLNQVNIIHRDLRADNLFFTEDGIKLSDFDNAFVKGYSGVQNVGVTMREEISAPELIKLMQLDCSIKEELTFEELYQIQAKCDIYSFGVLLKELIKEGSFKVEDKQVIETMKYLITSMMKEDPKQRLELCQIKTIFESMASKYCLKVAYRKVQHHKKGQFQLPNIVFHPSSVSKSHSNSFSLSDWSLQEDLPKLIHKQICPPSPNSKVYSPAPVKFRRPQMTLNK